MSNPTRVLEHSGTPRPTPLLLSRPSTPLPKPAADALARLERPFLPVDVVKAVTHFEVAAARYDELSARPASTLSPAEFDAFQAAQQTMTDAFGVLAESGRTDLLAPLEAATRYRSASAHLKALAACGDFEGCEYVRDEMTDCLCQLKAAGRLDLVGGA